MKENKNTNIVHIINSLGDGGAENMLLKLLKYDVESNRIHQVITLVGKETFISKKISNLGIKVINVELNKKPWNIIKIISTLYKADVISSWLYQSDFISAIFGKLLLKKRVIWNIRHSNINKRHNKKMTLLVLKVNKLFSRYIDVITYNSNTAKQIHENYGFSPSQSKVIYNGFEEKRFVYSSSIRKSIRSEFEIKEETPVFISVGRWNIQKGYFYLLKAFEKYKGDFRLILLGTNLDNKNKELVFLIDKFNLKDKVILLGKRHDVVKYLSASDIYISSSLGESFSNAIAEAMLVGLKCIVTDVGDSKQIVGDYGVVIKPEDDKIISETIKKMDFEFNNVQRDSQRKFIIENFSMSRVLDEYEKLYLRKD
ncbi:glycosyltransferase [Enterococcus casseliflavus]|uniref:glycosyltransferase n=1 Tax=Enterococcus casseliflavus TaxID=37734 RepID=UPI0001B6D43B|nr:glycosyltransferase [Enterococcus casseliflavus]EEV28617.1 predicted protein [Enterococcus casseliflavus EC30]